MGTGMVGMGSGSLSPCLPAQSGGHAGAQVRGRAGGGGGHLLLPTGAREGTSQGWAGPGLGDKVRFFHFFLFLFFWFAKYCFAN